MAVDGAELARLRKELEATQQPAFATLRDYLRQVRALRVRDIEYVTKYGAELLARHSRKLTLDELWEVHEQVAVAAMEAGCKQLALRLVQNVHKRFPEGARASRLTGMYFELMHTPAEAEALYAKELEKDPCNAIILKRMVGLRRGQGDLTGASTLLREYLQVHTTDWVAWEEAADLYLQLQMYQQAVFCLEELLLHQPADISRHLLLADTLYTLGGAHNWRAARSYYSGVIELSKGQNLRALCGVCACAAQLSGIRRGAGGSSTGEEELPRLAGERLQQQYAVHCPAKLPLVRGMLKAQGLL
ncbi:hypothetical protein D9Q98_009081 [Chlorella vulgaris]|uniref:ER membrane protein complex subunit 2 n=1 Tax=Chlorella vulgaris TaxID=3077 RepID=A0A9D4YTB5_CHLVU|nr:hypothetical protein D9Q98_009081 [Chlorella vulgaris]